MYVNRSFVPHTDNYDYDWTHHELHEGEPTRTFRLATFFISIPICLGAVLVDLLLIFIILKFKALKTRGDYFLYMYKNGYKYIIGGVYPVHFILAFIVTNVCFNTTKDIKFHISFIFVTIVYAICLAVAVKIKIDCRKSPLKNNKYLKQALSVTLYTILFFLPVVFYYNMLSIVERIMADDNLEILRSMAFISEYFAYAASFVLIYKLYKENKFYKLAICKIFCSSNSELDFGRLDIVPQADIDKK